MQTLLHTDNYKVLGSGSFLLFDSTSDATVRVNFQPDVNLSAEIKYKFIKDPSINDTDVEAKVEDNRMTITCKNADNILGNGMVAAALLAKIGEKKVYHNFFVSRPGENSPRMFYYTFYVEE